MIRRVRRQFILITMAMLTALLMVPLVALNVITEAMSYNQTRDLLEQIAISEAAIQENEFDPPDNMPPDQPEPKARENQNFTAVTTAVITSDNTAIQTMTMTTEAARTKASQTDPQRPIETKPVQTKPPVTTTAPVSRETTPRMTSTAPQYTKPEQTLPPRPDPEEPDHPEEPWHPYDEWDPYKPEDPWYDAVQDAYDAAPMAMLCTPEHVAISRLSSVTATTAADTEKKQNERLMYKKENSVTIDHFLCFADENGNLTHMDGTDTYSREDGQMLLDHVVKKGETDGNYEQLQFFRKDFTGGFVVVFSDRSADHLLLKQLLSVSILVFILMEGVVFFLTMILTKRAMRPMQETFERQRQFISDAGHELKTPLTIISANTDILQDEIGPNKWLSYIQSQTERMRTLVSDMMNLTKLEMGNPRKDFTSFSLSAAVSSAALPFESQAFEQEKTLTLEIQEDLQYTGNMEQIVQLVAIFIDNAIKYSDEHGEIRVTLQQIRDKKTLKIFNTGKGVTEIEKEKIFERFYRSDSSRARRTGGYGLGLSIAKSIADTHRIKIQVESEYEHWICFILTF
ncbi:HAMP domain-containing sensor histidine kinase [Ruminococcus sp.]|uniref:sensor histidine kinase n=1 Tax=Ruminococcus sp. TaxID=41978 RepID=UPI0025D2246F|nr:HAMP domain-containing sensor histidine kinase [Ruminococcus sp.]